MPSRASLWKRQIATALTSVIFFVTILARGAIEVTVDHNDAEHATSAFKFNRVPSPAKNDSGSAATFALIDGVPDSNSGEISTLNDGKIPADEDAPSDNFFFAQPTSGGRILVDLHEVISVRQVNTYSWHTGSRAPQVYKLYGSDGFAKNFNQRPVKGSDPVDSGWQFLTTVDTRSKSNSVGGQYGVSISENSGILGSFRYLLFDISQTEINDAYGNTFFSEIDVVGKNDPLPVPATPAEPPRELLSVRSTDGKCEFVIQSIVDPDIWDWVNKKLAPALAEWFPKISALLPSEGYTAPSHITITIKPGRGVASTSGDRITANATWLRRELDHEALGSIIHEMVHVIQQYHGRRDNPGWLVEGIADYVRYYEFEPQTHGAEIKERGIDRVRYDQSYRISANFLNWVSVSYDSNIVTKLNAAMREGRYSADIWKASTGKPIHSLGDEWKAGLQKTSPSK